MKPSPGEFPERRLWLLESRRFPRKLFLDSLPGRLEDADCQKIVKVFRRRVRYRLDGMRHWPQERRSAESPDGLRGGVCKT